MTETLEYRPDAAVVPDRDAIAAALPMDVIDVLRHPLLVLDEASRVLRANEAFLRTFHVSADDTIGAPLASLDGGAWNQPAVHAHLQARLDGASDATDLELDGVFPHVGRRILQCNARAFRETTGGRRLLLLGIEDVTERRATSHRLAAHGRELQRSNEALQEFALVASHDLQEPLRKIIAFGDLLAQHAGPALDDESRAHLGRMQAAATRMRELITAVLAYAQVTARARAFADCDLATLVRRVIEELEAQVTATGAIVTVGPLPVIQADRQQLHQLLTNLVANALKYRHAGRLPVIHVEATTDAHDRCVLTVADNGIGFTQEQGERIFRMFERLHARAAYAGSGIGLAICRRIVERHGGTIVARAQPGLGATFEVTLPIAHDAAGVAA
ncbi:MAG: PAS domain-containing protein [Gemmatimonadetes bacterium]|nr:PAS domain-containing protein [Gemmatimonadota bacterium]